MLDKIQSFYNHLSFPSAPNIRNVWNNLPNIECPSAKKVALVIGGLFLLYKGYRFFSFLSDLTFNLGKRVTELENKFQSDGVFIAVERKAGNAEREIETLKRENEQHKINIENLSKKVQVLESENTQIKELIPDNLKETLVHLKTTVDGLTKDDSFYEITEIDSHSEPPHSST
jgi:hypothetical protein